MIRHDFNEPQQCFKSMNQEQGASSWLTTLLIKERGYDLSANEIQLGITEITVNL